MRHTEGTSHSEDGSRCKQSPAIGRALKFLNVGAVSATILVGPGV